MGAKCAARVANSDPYFLMTGQEIVSTSAYSKDIRMCLRAVFIGVTMSILVLYLSSACPVANLV
jgi:hypothetical protein